MDLRRLEESEELQQDGQNLMCYWQKDMKEEEYYALKDMIIQYIKTTVLSDDKADVLYDFLIDYRKKLGL